MNKTNETNEVNELIGMAIIDFKKKKDVINKFINEVYNEKDDKIKAELYGYFVKNYYFINKEQTIKQRRRKTYFTVKEIKIPCICDEHLDNCKIYTLRIKKPVNNVNIMQQIYKRIKKSLIRMNIQRRMQKKVYTNLFENNEEIIRQQRQQQQENNYNPLNFAVRIEDIELIDK